MLDKVEFTIRKDQVKYDMKIVASSIIVSYVSMKYGESASVNVIGATREDLAEEIKFSFDIEVSDA